MGSLLFVLHVPSVQTRVLTATRNMKFPVGVASTLTVSTIQDGTVAGAFDPTVYWNFGFSLHAHEFENHCYRAEIVKFRHDACGRQIAQMFQGVETAVCLQCPTGCTRLVSFQDQARRR